MVASAMADGIDIDRSAKVIVDRHGPEAPIHAAMKANEFLAKGEMDGYAVWRRICAALDELLAQVAGVGKSIHYAG